MKDYNLFKAYYCGVCQTIKKEYGFPARYFLSYEAVFLAVLLSSVSEQAPQMQTVRCLANPAVRRPAVQRDAISSYAAAVNVLLVWFKLKDDRQDSASLRAALLMPLMFGKRNKAKKRYPALYEKLEQSLNALLALEKSGCAVPDEVADVFGKQMADVFDAPFIENAEKRRILTHCGYLLGRFIYLLDAWADRAEDEKKKTYNPFLLSEQTSAEQMKISLQYTLAELGNSLQLLAPVRNREILENVIYLSLNEVLDTVFSGRKNTAIGGVKEKHHERPL